MRTADVKEGIEYAAVPSQRGRAAGYRIRYRIKIKDKRHHVPDRTTGGFKPYEGNAAYRGANQPAMLAEYLDAPHAGRDVLVYGASIDGPWDEWQAEQEAERRRRQAEARHADEARMARDALARRVRAVIGEVGRVESWYSADDIVLDATAARALVDLAERAAPQRADAADERAEILERRQGS